MSEIPFNLPEGMTSGDSDKLRAKISRFLGRIADLHIVADFDRTLTERRAGSNEDITSWNILRDHLPAEGQRHCQELFAIARPKELAGTMTVEDAVAWWSGMLDTYAHYRINMNDVERDFLHRATIRRGTKEFFDLSAQLSAPITVLSAGVKDVIDLWGSITVLGQLSLYRPNSYLMMSER